MNLFPILKQLLLALLLTPSAALFTDGTTAGGETAGRDTTELRVLSYNIHHGRGVDRKLDLQRIARVISTAKPHIVALQEVDKNVERSGSVDQPAELAKLIGMEVVFGANISLQGGEYGNALLSRFPIRKHKNHKLPNRDDGEQRGVLEAEIAIADHQEPLWFFATHLDHRSDDQERVASARFINELVAKEPSRPALLAGDLNDVIDSPTLKELAVEWRTSNMSPLPTIPVKEPTRQIDFILIRPTGRWQVVETTVLDEQVASDHRPILTVLRLLPQQDSKQ